MTDETPTPAEDASAPIEDHPSPEDHSVPEGEPIPETPISEDPVASEHPPISGGSTPAVAPAHEMTRDSQNWATGAHLSAFVQFIGVPSLIGPLLVWLMKRDDDPYVAAQAKEALNFNISFMIYSLAAGLAIFVLIGVVLLPIVLIAWFVLVIVGAMAASRGEDYRYPLTMRLVN